jgi:hypothetical protein
MNKREFDRIARAATQARVARLNRDNMIRELHKHYSVRAIAEAAGLSHGRVGQIIKEGKHD